MDDTNETIRTQIKTTTPVVETPVAGKATRNQTIEYLIYFAFGFLEVLLVFRLILKLTGANPVSSFVSIIYAITGLFTFPFNGIFHQTATTGIETTAILEPATMISIVVYALLAFGIVKLMRILSGKKQIES